MGAIVLVVIIAGLYFAGFLQLQEPAVPQETPVPAPSGTGSPEPAPPEGAEEGSVQEPEPLPYDSCIEKESSVQKNFCFKDKAIELKDRSGCGLVEPFYKNDCLAAYAVAVSDAEACGEISSEPVKWECLYSNGVENNDANSCLEIPYDVNKALMARCLNDVAIDSGDVNLCSKMNYVFYEGVLLKDSCFENFFSGIEDPEICLQVSDVNSEDSCLESAAKNSGSTEACAMISYTAKADGCLYSLATESDVTEACGLISDEVKARECAEASLEGLDLCLTKKLGEKNACFKDLAVSEDNPEHCDLIEGNFELRSQCFKELAELDNDASLCWQITPNKFEMVNECFYNVAVAANNPDVCEDVPFSASYLDCFASIAENLGEISICSFPEKETISSYSFYKISELCIKEFSVKTGSTDYCGRIGKDALKQQCFDLNAMFR
ncbi:MAG TPA: hypothetical protein VFF09_04105 [archaeon]|nr:hypothetical protein [archaeon]